MQPANAVHASSLTVSLVRVVPHTAQSVSLATGSHLTTTAVSVPIDALSAALPNALHARMG